MSDLSVRWSKEALSALIGMFNLSDVRNGKGGLLRLALEDKGRKRAAITVVIEKEVTPPSIERSPKRAQKGKGNAKARA